MGMGGLVKAGEKSGAEGDPATGEESKATGKATSRPAIPAWATGFGRTAGDPTAEKARKKSVVEEQEEDDRHIRFTINNVGQRMTKEDFIQTMQKLEKSKRRDVVEASSASSAVKTLARQDAQPKKQQGQSSTQPATQSAARGKETAVSAPIKPKPESAEGSSKDSSGEASRSSSRSPFDRSDELSRGAPETDAERRRRAAAFKGVGGSAQEESGETPAERRRREAALGMSSTVPDDDSEDDDTPRVLPPKRGIRFADVPDRGRD